MNANKDLEFRCSIAAMIFAGREVSVYEAVALADDLIEAARAKRQYDDQKDKKSLKQRLENMNASIS